MATQRTEDVLFGLADEHEGVFAGWQATEAAISPQHLNMLKRRGVLLKLSRGIYRLKDYPANEQRAQLWEAVLLPSIRRSPSIRGTLSHLSAPCVAR